jgi:hypothetical protein
MFFDYAIAAAGRDPSHLRSGSWPGVNVAIAIGRFCSADTTT